MEHTPDPMQVREELAYGSDPARVLLKWVTPATLALLAEADLIMSDLLTCGYPDSKTEAAHQAMRSINQDLGFRYFTGPYGEVDSPDEIKLLAARDPREVYPCR